MFGMATGGGGASGALMVVAVIGILAAIAIPNFVKYQERAREAMLSSQLGTMPGDETASDEEREAARALRELMRAQLQADAADGMAGEEVPVPGEALAEEEVPAPGEDEALAEEEARPQPSLPVKATHKKPSKLRSP